MERGNRAAAPAATAAAAAAARQAVRCEQRRELETRVVFESDGGADGRRPV